MNRFINIPAEYAATNPAAFDIAQHFHEWMADYGSSTPYTPDPERYPTLEQRHNFYRAYLSPVKPAGVIPGGTEPLPEQPDPATLLLSSSTSPTSPSPSSVVSLNTFSPSPTLAFCKVGPNLSNAHNAKALRLESSSTSIAHDDIPQAGLWPSGAAGAAQIDILEAEVVQAWAPAPFAYCTMWGIVQSRNDVLAGRVGEFDYLSYAAGQTTAFREELRLREIHA